MMPLQHIALSSLYGGSVLALSGSFDHAAMITLATVLGGEAIDVVDHLIYQAFTGRSQPQVRQGQSLIFKGHFREGIARLVEGEDDRAYNRLLLHTLPTLVCLIFTLAFVVLFNLPLGAFWLVFLGSVLLHMLCDIASDLRMVGHWGNWLWPFARWGWDGKRPETAAVVFIVGGLALGLVAKSASLPGQQTFLSSASTTPLLGLAIAAGLLCQFLLWYGRCSWQKSPQRLGFGLGARQAKRL